MLSLRQLQSEHVLIVGFSERTGLEVARFLMRYGVRVSISDCRSEGELAGVRGLLPAEPLHFYSGPQSASQLYGVDRVVLSPGVPRSIELIRQAKHKGIPVLGEVELSFLLSRSQAPILIGISGTDGKTTTAHLVAHVLRQQRTVKLLGNSGVPFISALDELSSETYVVLELSSYMLEEVVYLCCDVACLLNLAEDHLDRYPSFQAYREAKYALFSRQTEENVAVLNLDDPFYHEASLHVRGKAVRFSMKSPESELYCDGEGVYLHGEPCFALADVPPFLRLYRENLLAAFLLCQINGCTNDEFLGGLQSFRPLAHRHELVRECGGVRFVNDSKATTVHAVIHALSQYSKNVILLMGGVTKQSSFQGLRTLLPDRVKALILFGRDAEKIARELEFAPTIVVPSLCDAVRLASSLAKTGDSVLLAPGCASFDLYKDYEERGEDFRRLVYDL